jgi:hypothetical protein
MSALVLGCYDDQALTRLFCEEGIVAEIRGKGFDNPRVEVSADTALPHVRLHADKHGTSHLLLDACLTDAVIAPEFFLERGLQVVRPMSVAVIHWARVQDPTVRFAGDRPRLPLQEHPGLGILRRVFRVAARMANQLGKDGLANMPKFPHDALIFFRSLLFLFADPAEQGRLEALWRDLDHLGLANLSLAVAAGATRDEKGCPVSWRPGFQVYPLSAAACAYFHSDAYTQARSAARLAARYGVDVASAGEMLGAFERSAAGPEALRAVGALS